MKGINEIGRCVMVGMTTLALTLYAANASTDNSNFILGVGTHVGQNKNTANDVLALFSLGGIRSIRDEAYWSSIEKSPGQLAFPNDLSDLDKLLYGVHSRGGRPLIILDYGNANYDNGEKPFTPAGRKAFSQYAKYIATRYASLNPIFEIWNEWNAGTWLAVPDPKADAQSYALLVKEVIPIVRKAAPGALILVGATGGYDSKWTERFLQTSDGEMADGFSIHPYVYIASPDHSPEAAVKDIDALNKQIMDAAAAMGRSPMPIYVTEIGWPTSQTNGGVTEERQANYGLRFLLLARSRPFMRGIWWYDLINDGNDSKNAEHNFGLVREGLSAKPLFSQIINLSACLQNSLTPRSSSNTTGLVIVNVNCGNGTAITAVWNTSQNPVRFNVKSEDTNLTATRNGSSMVIPRDTSSMMAEEAPVLFFHKTNTLLIDNLIY